MMKKKYFISHGDNKKFTFFLPLIILVMIFFGFTNTAKAAPNDSSLSNLQIIPGVLTPTFASSTFNYTVSVVNSAENIYIIPTANDAGATIKVNGTIYNGIHWPNIDLDVGNNTIDIVVTAEDLSTSTYTIIVTRELYSIITTTYYGTGSSPYGIAFDGVNMWTANYDGNSVTKISPTGEMTTYLGTGTRPYGIAFDGTNMWTANYGGSGNSVTKISPTGEMTNYTGTGGSPIAIAFDGTNMWTANYHGSSVTKISPTGVMTTYSIGTMPQAIAFDGVNMWTANYNGNSVTKISPEGSVTTYSGTGANPRSIAFDGTNMWTADEGSKSVTKISPTGEMTTYSGISSNPWAITFDGTNMWVSNGSGFTKITLGGEIKNYSNAYGQDAIISDGTSLWLTNRTNSVIKVTLVMASTDSSLSNLTVNQGTLNPTFGSDILNYTDRIAHNINSINITPTVNSSGATIKVNGVSVDSGNSTSVALNSGDNIIDIVVTAADSISSSTYEIIIQHDSSLVSMITYSGTGSYPYAIAFDGTNMWTANSNGNSVTKISPTGEMTTYSGTGARPYGIAFDGTNMWTANSNGNSVTKISPTGEMTTYSGTGGSPVAIAFDGTNMWTANTGGSVTKISPTGEMTTYSGTGSYPYAITFDGTNMWTANLLNDSVTKISPTGEMTTYTGTGSDPYGIAFDGTNMWTANSNGNSVTKISPTGEMTTYAGTGTRPYGIAFDGTNMWTANNSGNSVTKISPEGVATTYVGIAYPYAIAFDGVNMWTANANCSVTKVISILFVVSDDSSLSNLSINHGTLDPVFTNDAFDYTATTNYPSIDITSTTTNLGATVKVNGVSVNSGEPTSIALAIGENIINIVVTATDEITISTYTIVVTREGLSPSYLAFDVLGQIDELGDPTFTTSDSDNASSTIPNNLGLNFPEGLTLDANNHRLFVSDSGNDRILQYDLDDNNNLIDYIPDHVLGQS
ncbi:MAG: cadherin-like beta sandwich domain-containing protein, partial [Patescibacteria group bacterium]